MTRRLLVSYLVLAAIILAALMLPLGITFSTSQKRDLLARVERDAVSLASLGQGSFPRPTPAEQRRLREAAQAYQARNGYEVVIVDERARLIVGSRNPRGNEPVFEGEAEIVGALDGNVSTGEGDDVNGVREIRVAVPIASQGQVSGAVRIGVPSSELNDAVREFWLILSVIATVMMGAVALLGLLLARSVGKPLARLGSAAQEIGRGNLAVRADDESGPTEIRDVAKSFDAMAGRLETMIESQRGFASDASHQLRTPLAAIHLRLENAIHTLDDSPARKDIEAALGEAERLNEMVAGLLALARAENSENAPEPIDVREIIEARVTLNAELAEHSGVGVTATCGALRALAQPGALDQVLDNLIENAIAVSPRGSDIHVRAETVGGWAEIHVVDQGPGMSPDDRAAAFERFWSRRPTNNLSGTGLGLAMVRRLAEASGGTAELRDADGGGLDALVRLPAPHQ